MELIHEHEKRYIRSQNSKFGVKKKVRVRSEYYRVGRGSVSGWHPTKENPVLEPDDIKSHDLDEKMTQYVWQY